MTATLTEQHTQLSTDVSKDSLRAGLAAFPTGVVAVSGIAAGTPEVMVSSSFAVGISWEPALVSLSVQNTSRTWPRLRHAERIGVSVLAEGQTHLCRQLASREGDRFAGVATHVTDDGAILLDGSSLWLETSVHAEIPAGDHTVVLLEVHGFADQDHTHAPATLHRNTFHSLTGLDN